MADVLDLQDLPELQGEESEEMKLWRMQELVPRPFFLGGLYPQISIYIAIYIYYIYICIYKV